MSGIWKGILLSKSVFWAGMDLDLTKAQRYPSSMITGVPQCLFELFFYTYSNTPEIRMMWYQSSGKVTDGRSILIHRSMAKQNRRSQTPAVAGRIGGVKSG